MLPWRPLGMLAFGLTVIFFFIRLHGDGYDFPVKVAEFLEELEFPKRPDRSFIEISGVYHDNFRDGISNKLYTTTSRSRTEHGREHKDHTYSQAEGDISGSAPEPGATAGGNDGDKDHGQKFMAGWNSQWHLGKKKTANAESGKNGIDHNLQAAADEGQQWIWMTNIWHEDNDCGPGHLRQYRRRLDHVLMDDNSTTWELMYTHRFPGPITHTSLSKRVLPVSSTNEEVEEPHSQQGQESIRLAIVYKVVEDEHVAYRSRVYHFGIFQSRDDLRECGSTSAETCHAHAPFVSFDYVLPGSTPIKDFTLEHDTILYSRLSDTSLFRSLKLPTLKVGATSPERPYALSYGSPGPLLNCGEKKNAPYRMSYLAKIPSSSER
ncbi:hypothetical protein EDD21DRAFT_375874 [Dissophora ornata]|nr:hypothetical protein EDD21DRAFT_375874 [Dissophora ornata]